MAVQQKQKKPTRRSTHLTVADWMLVVVHLLLGGFFATTLPSLLRRFPNDFNHVLVTVAILLATLGYLGASLTLLLRLRRAAAVFQLLCVLAWWCGAAYFRLVTSPDYRLDIGALVWLGGMVLIGVFHLPLARWLWRFQREEEE